MRHLLEIDYLISCQSVLRFDDYHVKETISTFTLSASFINRASE